MLTRRMCDAGRGASEQRMVPTMLDKARSKQFHRPGIQIVGRRPFQHLAVERLSLLIGR